MVERKFSEIVLADVPNDKLFLAIADRIVIEFEAEIIEKVNDLDSIYWDFKIGSEIITLHQQIFMGITIFSKELNNASIKANKLVEKIGFQLKYTDSQFGKYESDSK